MWNAFRHGNINRRALEALHAAVVPKMVPVLANKPTTKEAWEAIAKACIGNDCARRSTLQKLVGVG
jgi:hypothetical protein